ncbi:MAG TPA: O-antigen ligase family protein [Hyphomicrobiaceae bacterium]|nr:O-antigen ligase family protein [Hyphomicrobiaceae bacterium]
MAASIATLLYGALIAGLFWLDRDRARTSLALWIPVIWFSLAASRSPSEWLQSARPGASSEALLEGDPINRAVYAGLIALGLLVLLVRAGRVAKLLQANAFVAFFLLYCLLSLTWADYPDVGLKRWVKAAGDLIMVLVVVSDRDPLAAIKRLLVRTGFILIPLSVLMIKYYPDLARYYDRWDWTTYYSGVTTNKNSLGAICLIFGLTSLWQLLTALFDPQQAGRGRRAIAHAAILVMVAWLFWLARSMTALACFALGVCVLLALELRRVPAQGGALGRSRQLERVIVDRLTIHALVAVLIAVPSMVLFIGIETILKMLGKDPTLTDRTMIWELLLAHTASNWFGTGFENFWLGPRLERIWSEYRWAPNQAHNGYLEVYLNLGWVGIGLLALVLAAGYQTVMRRLRRSSFEGTLMLAYFVTGIVYNFTEAALFRISAPMWFVLLLAITRVPKDVRLKQPLPSFDIRRARSSVHGKVGEHAVAASRST